MVKNLITVQESYINTYHPDFMGSGGSIMSMFDPEVFDKKLEEQTKKPSDRMTFEQIEENDLGDNNADKDGWNNSQKQFLPQYQAE